MNLVHYISVHTLDKFSLETTLHPFTLYFAAWTFNHLISELDEHAQIYAVHQKQRIYETDFIQPAIRNGVA
jgi:hypothetical protein